MVIDPLVEKVGGDVAPIETFEPPSSPPQDKPSKASFNKNPSQAGTGQNPPVITDLTTKANPGSKNSNKSNKSGNED